MELSNSAAIGTIGVQGRTFGSGACGADRKNIRTYLYEHRVGGNLVMVTLLPEFAGVALKAADSIAVGADYCRFLRVPGSTVGAAALRSPLRDQ